MYTRDHMISSIWLFNKQGIIMSNNLIDGIKSPEDLLAWLNKNITYESKKKGYLRLPEQVIKDKKAHCWEACDLTHIVLTHLGYPVETLYIDTRNCSVTHTAIIYTHNHKYYWFEWAWKKYEGIHEFKSFDDLIDYFRTCFIEEYGTHYTFVKTRALLINKDSTEESIVKNINTLTFNLNNYLIKRNHKSNLSIESFIDNRPSYLRW